RRAGSGIARNFCSHSRSTLADAAVKPRIASPSRAVEGRNRSNEAGSASERTRCVIGASAAGRGWQDTSRECTYLHIMKKLVGFIGSTIGGYAGWYLGALVGGFMTSFMVSMVGTGFGIYYGVKIA